MFLPGECTLCYIGRALGFLGAWLIQCSFKPRLGWKREAGEYDGIEQFNFYRGEFEDEVNRVPECIKPFMDEIRAFTEVRPLNPVSRNALMNATVSHRLSQSALAQTSVESVGAT